MSNLFVYIYKYINKLNYSYEPKLAYILEIKQFLYYIDI